jgi:hypothetical protein
MMSEDNRRNGQPGDRRAHARGGRRDSDQKKPWYLRRRFWLATVSLVVVGWKRISARSKKILSDARRTDLAA